MDEVGTADAVNRHSELSGCLTNKDVEAVLSDVQLLILPLVAVRVANGGWLTNAMLRR